MESILVGIFGFVAVLLSVAISLVVKYLIYVLIIDAIDIYLEHKKEDSENM